MGLVADHTGGEARSWGVSVTHLVLAVSLVGDRGIRGERRRALCLRAKHAYI